MCVLGLCALIDMEQIPQVLNEVSGQILPAFILLFNGLKRAYACHAEHENDSDDEDEAEDDEDTGKGLALRVCLGTSQGQASALQVCDRKQESDQCPLSPVLDTSLVFSH